MTEARRGTGPSPSPLTSSSPTPPAGTLKTPSVFPTLCFQRLTAIQQVLNAQKISFLLRGGVRVVVAMRAVDTGEGPGRAHLCSVGWAGVQAPQMTLATVYTGQRGPSADRMSLLAQWWSSKSWSALLPFPVDTHGALALIYIIWGLRLGFPSGANGNEPACQSRRHKRPEFDP